MEDTAAGFRVVIADIDGAVASQRASRLDPSGDRAIDVLADVTSSTSVDALIATTT